MGGLSKQRTRRCDSREPCAFRIARLRFRRHERLRRPRCSSRADRAGRFGVRQRNADADARHGNRDPDTVANGNAYRDANANANANTVANANANTVANPNPNPNRNPNSHIRAAARKR
jgi:hypothetical protein